MVPIELVEGGALGIADAGSKIGSSTSGIGVLAFAVDKTDGIIPQIVRAGAGALVGVSDGASVLQAPLAAGGDRAVAPPRRIAPASFADERFRVVYGDRPEEGWYCRPPQWTSDVRNPGRVLLARHIARRRAELLTDVFERLRSGKIATVATAPATGLRASVSADVWSSPGVVLDLRDSALWAGQVAVFLGVEAAPSRPRGASRSAIEQSVAAFDAAMLEAERRFTVGELVDAARTVLGDVSGLEIEAALRRAPVSARAGAGRRPARETPTAAELADAAGRAAPTHS